MTTKVYEALNWASSFLEEHHYEAQIAHILLQHHTGWNRTKLLTELQAQLDTQTIEKFTADVHQAAAGKPVQHITGNETFYGRSYIVNQHVLIPRPETEELVEKILETIPTFFGETEAANLTIVDVGTGSGIIATSLKLEHPQSRVLASDISFEALAVAKKNASELGANLDFFEGDLLQPLIEAGEQASIIVSNPPYIPEGDRDSMKENVKDHEPEGALFAGKDGLTIYRRLIKQLPAVLKTPGMIAFEIGHGQGEDVKKLLSTEYPQAQIEVINDINNKQRIVLAAIRT
ncbi:protein-(glutamine-N5) methyltransferase, release factor-specific [Salipaludibacillus neizhouensis]|uniref:Release factor glutamine methyltransferase n=1 Tax=Salipaludibacillus neizhouensis TaxID=885475 RepID=A0A3A9K6W9_9BACI|nr:peptide chain release factor N(5)-glutamine methyltransferase [Salipaludibacillus neizhouensis]RKL67989.1 protein-(glutamine-N5) methyltransferase, release factor-specific [Salipaludibacillus neizhouensis]